MQPFRTVIATTLTYIPAVLDSMLTRPFLLPMEFSGRCMVVYLILTVCMIHGCYIVVEAENTNFSYSYFSSPDDFLTVGDVQYYPDKKSFLLNGGAVALMTDSCGKLSYKDPVRMKDTASGAVVSFSTAFTFELTGENFVRSDDGWLHGDGFAFTIARNNTLEDGGGTLCLLQTKNNGLSSNQVFAVEFDTFRNPEYADISDNHIGVDINSVNSSRSFNLCGGEVYNCTYLVNGGSFTSWIDYDNTTQKLEVYFTNGSLSNNKPVPKPLKPVIEATQPLGGLLNEYMYIGFSASIGAFSEVHQIQAWQFASFGLPVVVPPPVAAQAPVANAGASSSHGSKVGIIAGISSGVGGALLLAALLFTKYRRRASFTKQRKFNLADRNLVPRVFTHKELSKATKNFSRSEMLGSGGFGAVYKGVLPSGAVVAVKRMQHESEQGEEGFQAEAASLSQIRHRNLVQLRGWCHDDEQLMLVYDYMCNGSLDEWLFRFPKQKAVSLNLADSLPLMMRLSIISGVAAALSYLHEECKQCVLHRDIKSSNVLLDEDLNAYLGDFGLARLIDHQKMEKTTVVAGTLGYMAPEMLRTGKATKESDVYSFGVLMLEVMCGTRPLDINAIERGEGTLVDRTWYAHESGNILRVADVKLGTFPTLDADLYGGMELHDASSLFMTGDGTDQNTSAVFAASAATEDRKMVTNLLHLALLCCHPNPEDRPTMRQVSQSLQASDSMELSLPPLPEHRPHARYHARGLPIIHSNSTSLQSDNVQDAGQGSSLSTLTSSAATAVKHANFQDSSGSISSSIFTGR